MLVLGVALALALALVLEGSKNSKSLENSKSLIEGLLVLVL